MDRLDYQPLRTRLIHSVSISQIDILEHYHCQPAQFQSGDIPSEIEARFIVLPITGRICVRAGSLPASYPNDPADRIISGTALVEGLPLITADEGMRRSKVLRTIW